MRRSISFIGISAMVSSSALLTAGVSTGAMASTLVTYNDFTSTAGLTMVGAAATANTSDGTVMRINSAQPNQAGAFYSTSPVTLGTNDTFSTAFTFRMTNPGGVAPADGITFVLAANSTGLGNIGNGIGYSGVGNSVAIEFDTYNNAPGNLGPIPSGDANSSNHVAIDTNGVLDDTAAVFPYGKQTCDFNASTPYTAYGCMSNGDLWTVQIGYDGSMLNVNLKDGNGSTFTAINNYAIDIGSYLGTNTAYLGFTGSTGAGNENQDIISWSYSDTTQLAPPTVPIPGSALLFASGLITLLDAMRRNRSRIG